MNNELQAAIARRTDDTYSDGVDGIHERLEDDAILAAEFIRRLASDEAERVERAKPADDEWIYVKTRGVKWRLKWDADSREAFLGETSIGIKRTQGEWLDLLRALKGGA